MLSLLLLALLLLLWAVTQSGLILMLIGFMLLFWFNGFDPLEPIGCALAFILVYVVVSVAMTQEI